MRSLDASPESFVGAASVRNGADFETTVKQKNASNPQQALPLCLMQQVVRKLIPVFLWCQCQVLVLVQWRGR